jgi:hypothetical protein
MKKLLFIFAAIPLLLAARLQAQSQTSTTSTNTTAVATAPATPANSGGLWGSLKRAAKAAKDSVVARKLANAQKKDSLHHNTFLGSMATTAAASVVKPGTQPGTTASTTSTGTAPTTSGSPLASLLSPSQPNAGVTPAGNGSTNNSTDKIAFQIDACTGNSSAKTVTIFFTIANPNNVNQNVAIGLGPACKVIDPDGNLCHPKECRLGDADGAHWTELPTGIKMKGSITFSNILPKQTQLALLQFNIFSVNSDGGRDGSAKQISVRNLNVAWQ